MNGSEANRYLRWAIPGWVAAISCVVFVVLDIISTPVGKGSLYESITDFIRTLTREQVLTNAFLIAVAGIPLGFIIYQFYFFIRWNSPFSKNGLFPPFIEGRLRDIEDLLSGISISDLSDNKNWRDNWLGKIVRMDDHTVKWRYIESFLTEIFQILDSKYQGVKLSDRNRHLSDMMHTLGASLGGVYLGFFIYLLMKVRIEKAPITYYSVIVGFSILLLIILLERGEKNKQFSSTSVAKKPITKRRHFLRKVTTSWHKFVSTPNAPEILGVLSGMFIFFVSPAILANNKYDTISFEYLLRFTLVLPVAFFWQKAAGTKGEKLIVIASFAIGSILCICAHYSRDTLLTWIDWSFTGPLFTFLLMNMVLLENRQNNRNDLIAFQHYTLLRYLNEERNGVNTDIKFKNLN